MGIHLRNLLVGNRGNQLLGHISERHEMTAKHAGKTYSYYVFDLSDIWED